MIRFLHTATPDATLRRCYDCRHLGGAVSLWCTNKSAVNRRRTNFPGCRDCPDWEPGFVKSEVGWWKRLTRDWIVV